MSDPIDPTGGFPPIPSAPSTAEPIDPGAPEPTPTPATVNLDPTQFAAAIKAAGLVPAQNVPQPGAKPPTQEEIAAARKGFGYMEIDDTFLTRFDNMETRKQAMQEFYDNSTAYALKVAQAMLEREREEWNGKLQPFEQERQTRQHEAMISRFEGQYEQLANPALAPLRDSVISSLQSAGKTFANEAEVFKAVAEGVAAIIKQTPGNEGFTLSAKGSIPSAKPNPNAITPAPRSGGGGGGGGTESSGSGLPPAAGLFPKIKS